MCSALGSRDKDGHGAVQGGGGGTQVPNGYPLPNAHTELKL